MTDILPGDILIGGSHGYIEHIHPDGTFVQHIPIADDLGNPLKINGIAIAPNGHFYTAAADPDATTYVPHDVACIPDGSGLLYAMQISPGVAELWKYDLDGNLLVTWPVPTDENWTTELLRLDISPDTHIASYTDSFSTVFQFNVETGQPCAPFEQLPRERPYIYSGLSRLPSDQLIVAMSQTGSGPRNAVSLDFDRTVLWTDEVNPDDGVFHACKRRIADGSDILVHAVSLAPTGINDRITSLASFQLPSLPIWTGFFFCSPINDDVHSALSASRLRDSGRWGAVLILDPAYSTQFQHACDMIMDARSAAGGTRSLDQCVARIYYGSHDHPNIDDIRSVSDARSWLGQAGFYQPLDYFVNNGGRWAALFNELLTDPTAGPQYSIDQRVMGYLGWALRSRYTEVSGTRRLFLLFPGPAGLLDTPYKVNFDYYWDRYDLRVGTPKSPVRFNQYQTWDTQQNLPIGEEIANKTMLFHSGSGVFDGVAAICYEVDVDLYRSTNTSDTDPAANKALRVLKWQRDVDGSGPVFVTETAGNYPCGEGGCGDDPAVGAALADFQVVASNMFATPIDQGGPNGLFLRAIYGYILMLSNDLATSGGWHEIGDRFLFGDGGWRESRQFS